MQLREDFIAECSRLIKKVRESPRFLDFLDALVTTLPLIKEQELAEKTGIPRTVINKYLRLLLLKNEGRSKVAACRVAGAQHALGLGTLFVLMRNWLPMDLALRITGGTDSQVFELRKKYIPHYYWIRTFAVVPEGFLLIYKYPLEEGYEFILDDLRRLGEVMYHYSLTHYYITVPKVSDYWLGDRFADPAEALDIALENPSGYKATIVTKVNERPRDIYDVYLFAILEVNSLLSTRALGRLLREQLPLSKGMPKVETHINHLIEDGAVYGHTILIHCNNYYLVHRSMDRCVQLNYDIVGHVNGSVWDILEFAMRYLYISQALVNPAEKIVGFNLRTPSMEDLAKLIKFLEEHYGYEHLIAIPWLSRLTMHYTIPFRCLDPITRRWVTDPEEVERLDEWLCNVGFDMEDAIIHKDRSGR